MASTNQPVDTNRCLVADVLTDQPSFPLATPSSQPIIIGPPIDDIPTAVHSATSADQQPRLYPLEESESSQMLAAFGLSPPTTNTSRRPSFSCSEEHSVNDSTSIMATNTSRGSATYQRRRVSFASDVPLRTAVEIVSHQRELGIRPTPRRVQDVAVELDELKGVASKAWKRAIINPLAWFKPLAALIIGSPSSPSDNPVPNFNEIEQTASSSLSSSSSSSSSSSLSNNDAGQSEAVSANYSDVNNTKQQNPTAATAAKQQRQPPTRETSRKPSTNPRLKITTDQEWFEHRELIISGWWRVKHKLLREDIESPDKCGYLNYMPWQGLLANNWKRRYCVLKGRWLFIMRHEGDLVAENIINMNHCVLDTFNQQRNAFCLHRMGHYRNFAFEARSVEGKLEWMGALLQSIKRYWWSGSDHPATAGGNISNIGGGVIMGTALKHGNSGGATSGSNSQVLIQSYSDPEISSIMQPIESLGGDVPASGGTDIRSDPLFNRQRRASLNSDNSGESAVSTGSSNNSFPQLANRTSGGKSPLKSALKKRSPLGSNSSNNNYANQQQQHHHHHHQHQQHSTVSQLLMSRERAGTQPRRHSIGTEADASLLIRLASARHAQSQSLCRVPLHVIQLRHSPESSSSEAGDAFSMGRERNVPAVMGGSGHLLIVPSRGTALQHENQQHHVSSSLSESLTTTSPPNIGSSTICNRDVTNAMDANGTKYHGDSSGE